ncbi:cysteine desulfurase [Nitrososphaera sp. AFS]|jgi:cysteine desulfurase/selenocysteine lyase|uniref:cysteine desulfurase n=1 Tax=Nitrososphaera sp. AFS TaxID=2301191 RepID=UPI0013921F81|nr:cysteine desulfurase [Nitrososphaera sp. AFS]NAL77921.1 cysteine desulfurase [Nitrososphaera sp. AFS]
MQKTALSVEEIRQDFPILKRKVGVGGSKTLVYLDNAATTQKPYAVINAMNEYYSNYNANIHRAVHQLGEEATFAYEQTREKVAKFINARSTDEIIFTRNATEAINLVAYSWGRRNIKRADTIVLTEMEHHSNIVPWQILSREKKSKICYLGVDDQGYLKMRDYERALEKEAVRLVSVSEMSNVLGTILPLKEIITRAHEDNVPVFVDAAQSVPHLPVDVQRTDCDFLAFSAHKMLGPTGVGVLYVKKEILEEMPPFIGGGDMIKEVHQQNVIYNDLPYRFEGGTQNIAGVVGFSAALDYLAAIGMDRVRNHELDLTRYALSALSDLKDVIIYGPKNFRDRGGVISFNIADIHPHDLATIMNEHGIAIRSGHHCAQVLMERLDVAATSRASFYIYNTQEEIDLFADALLDARRIFRI